MKTPRPRLGLDHATFLILPADSNFGGRDRVMSLAASELQSPRHCSLRGPWPSWVRA